MRTEHNGSARLELLDLEMQPETGESPRYVRFKTSNGEVAAVFHPVKGGRSAVIWVSGAAGGVEGPAGGLYPRLAERLTGKGIASLRLDYRFPNVLSDCVLDATLGIHFLEAGNYTRLAIVGHSFGGAVAIRAGLESERVVAVATLSSQTQGTRRAAHLSPRAALLVIHGSVDEVLSERCAYTIYERAREPKKLIIYTGCRHALDECGDQLDADLQSWLEQQLMS